VEHRGPTIIDPRRIPGYSASRGDRTPGQGTGHLLARVQEEAIVVEEGRYHQVTATARMGEDRCLDWTEVRSRGGPMGARPPGPLMEREDGRGSWKGS
jgi:hypothetical protein